MTELEVVESAPQGWWVQERTHREFWERLRGKYGPAAIFNVIRSEHDMFNMTAHMLIRVRIPAQPWAETARHWREKRPSSSWAA